MENPVESGADGRRARRREMLQIFRMERIKIARRRKVEGDNKSLALLDRAFLGAIIALKHADKAR